MKSTADTEETREIGHVGRGQSEYLHSDRDLYHVEHVGPERALLEDCRTGTLLDVPIAHLRDLEPVRPTEITVETASKPEVKAA